MAEMRRLLTPGKPTPPSRYASIFGDDLDAGLRRKTLPEMLTCIEVQRDRVSARPLWRSDEVHAPVAGEGLREGRDLPEPGFEPTP